MFNDKLIIEKKVFDWYKVIFELRFKWNSLNWSVYIELISLVNNSIEIW